MTDDIIREPLSPLHDLETRLAETAGQFLKTLLTIVRERHAAVPEMGELIANMHACRLEVTAVGPQIQLKLITDVQGEPKMIYGATFEEAGILQ